MSGADVLTFGCRLNLHESEAIAAQTRHLDDVVIVNTCAVTASAERQARQAVRRAHRERPDARIVVTGCAAQVAPEKWLALPGVSRIVGNVEKTKAAIWKADALDAPPRPVPDIMTAPVPATPVVETGGHVRALLQVQQGCDHRCTFCIIPFGRGPSRSVGVADVVGRARVLVEAGHREIVLTGVDIASWGQDLDGRPTLGVLCRAVLDGVPDLARLRLSSLDPAAFDEELWRVLAEEPRFAPHLHLSLQAANDLVLKRMKRRHSRAQAGALIERARSLRPELGVGADLIAGFPTETDEQAQDTLDFVRDHRIAYLHVFPYSERPGTPAARMPAVPNALRQQRAAALREAGLANRTLFWQGLVDQGLIGGTLDVLMEGPERGHSAQFAAIRLTGTRAQRGERLIVRAVALDPDAVVARMT